MKRQIRRGVFETNSSSTHSIAIPKRCTKTNYMSFNIGEFGWGWDEVDPADYLYTAIYELAETEDEAKEKIEKHFSHGKVGITSSGSAVAIFYAHSLIVPTGDAELKSIQINLSIKEWKVI